MRYSLNALKIIKALKRVLLSVEFGSPLQTKLRAGLLNSLLAR